MAYQASDGRQFTNRPPMMQHNRSLSRMSGKSEASGAGGAMDPLAQPGGGMGEQEQDGSAVAAEHGPAHEVHIHHDHEGGAHHVHSMHPDGHGHHSDHGSAEEAHEHGKKLAGGGAEEHEEPAEEEAEPEYE